MTLTGPFKLDLNQICSNLDLNSEFLHCQISHGLHPYNYYHWDQYYCKFIIKSRTCGSSSAVSSCASCVWDFSSSCIISPQSVKNLSRPTARPISDMHSIVLPRNKRNSGCTAFWMMYFSIGMNLQVKDVQSSDLCFCEMVFKSTFSHKVVFPPKKPRQVD